MKDTKKGSTEQSEMGLSLEDLIRRGARELIEKAIEVEEVVAKLESSLKFLCTKRQKGMWVSAAEAAQ